MPIIDDLLSYVHTNCSDAPITDVRIGLHWTAVVSRQVGLACTLPDKTCCFTEDIKNGGSLHHMSAFSLADFLHSPRLLESSVGMAALNSVLPTASHHPVRQNARDLIVEEGRGKNVALVGHFAFTELVRESAARLWVLELNPTPGDLPAALAPEILPRADVIGVTASTIINHTFDELARLFPPQALVVMMGPTTPLCPVLFDYGIHILAGARVVDAEHILHLVSQSSPLHRPFGLERLTLASQEKFGKIA